MVTSTLLGSIIEHRKQINTWTDHKLELYIKYIYFKVEKIKKGSIRLKICWQGIEKSLNCAKRVFIFLICGVFAQLSWLVGSMRKCFTRFPSESVSDSEENFRRYDDSMATLLYSKKLYFQDSISRKVYWSEQMCTRKVLKKPTKSCVKQKKYRKAEYT